ncbi:MAG: M20 family metallopeptidase [Armatimonadota bacterium]
MSKAATDTIIAAVDDARVVALERAMVRIPSFTLEETALALYLAQYMRDAGLEVELQTVPISDTTAGVQPVGRLRGTDGGSSLLLSGHMDYIGLEEPERWQHPPFAAVLADGFVYGRGTKDEKGGVCAAVAAAEALARSGVRLKGDLIVVPVMGHKTKLVGGGVGARHLMASGLRTDMAIVTENSNLGIATTCVGRVTARLVMDGLASTFEGRETDFYQCLGRLIDRLGSHFGSVPPGDWLTFSPHPAYPGFPMLLYGGVEVSARRCIVTVNVRTVPGQTADSVQADLERVLFAVGGDEPHYGSRVEVFNPVRHPHSIPDTDPLVQAIAMAHTQIRGDRPEIGLGPRRGAVADSWFFIESGIERTTVYGPGSIGPDFVDRPDERIAVKDLVDCTKIYALTAATLCGVA